MCSLMLAHSETIQSIQQSPTTAQLPWRKPYIWAGSPPRDPFCSILWSYLQTLRAGIVHYTERLVLRQAHPANPASPHALAMTECCSPCTCSRVDGQGSWIIHLSRTRVRAPILGTPTRLVPEERKVERWASSLGSILSIFCWLWLIAQHAFLSTPNVKARRGNETFLPITLCTVRVQMEVPWFAAKPEGTRRENQSYMFRWKQTCLGDTRNVPVKKKKNSVGWLFLFFFQILGTNPGCSKGGG